LNLISPCIYQEILVRVCSLEDLIEGIDSGCLIYLQRYLLIILQVPEDQIKVARFQLAIHNLKLVLPLYLKNLGDETWLSEIDFD